MAERQLPKKPLWFTPLSSPPRAPSIVDRLRHLAFDVTSFGSHTRFDEGLVTAIAATVMLTAPNRHPDAVERL